MGVKRKVILACLALLVLFSSPVSAERVFRPPNEEAAERLALSLLEQCAFHPEYGPEGEQPLTRWEGEIRVWVGGKTTVEDLRTLDAFLAELSLRVNGLPPLRRVRQDQNANIRIWFVPGYLLKHYIEGYVEGNWGFFHVDHPRNVSISARIGIAEDLTEQEDRNHLILEELVGALGLPGDHEIYTDSILYQGWTTTQQLSDVDWRMLNMLYSPALSPGMTWAEAEQALRLALGLVP